MHMHTHAHIHRHTSHTHTHTHTHTQKAEAAVVGEKLPMDCNPREQSEGGEPSHGRQGLPSVEMDPGEGGSHVIG